MVRRRAPATRRPHVTAPFHFAYEGVDVEELGRNCLRVRYPAGWPVHSREQVFHFDDAGLLRRNDYTAEVIGSWAHAAHLCEDHRTFDGLVVPTRRRVHPRRRNDEPLRAITLVKIAVDHVCAP